MKISNNRNGKELDAILLQSKTPEPLANFQQNVWRQIRCSAPGSVSSPAWGLPRLYQLAAYGFSVALIASATVIGLQLGQDQQHARAEAPIPVLQPQTLAGVYFLTHTGRY